MIPKWPHRPSRLFSSSRMPAALVAACAACCGCGQSETPTTPPPGAATEPSPTPTPGATTEVLTASDAAVFTTILNSVDASTGAAQVKTGNGQTNTIVVSDPSFTINTAQPVLTFTGSPAITVNVATASQSSITFAWTLTFTVSPAPIADTSRTMNVSVDPVGDQSFIVMVKRPPRELSKEESPTP